MELQITGKNMELTPPIRSYIERKIKKFNRHLPNIIESQIEITEEKTRSPRQHFVAQVTINSNGTLLRGEERGKDTFTAIDKVVDVMDRQIENYKGKLHKRGRGNSFARGETGRETMAVPAHKVIKTKRFTVEPMTVDEAIDQMELLSHDFFLFSNSDSEGLSLVYRRKDGNYGLIEPKLRETT
jgi:putative sigma-54 modulation protein